MNNAEAHPILYKDNEKKAQVCFLVPFSIASRAFLFYETRMVLPIRNTVREVILLSLHSSFTEVPYRFAIAPSVSPRWIRW